MTFELTPVMRSRQLLEELEEEGSVQERVGAKALWSQELRIAEDQRSVKPSGKGRECGEVEAAGPSAQGCWAWEACRLQSWPSGSACRHVVVRRTF